jgi:hypothetical protein
MWLGLGARGKLKGNQSFGLDHVRNHVSAMPHGNATGTQNVQSGARCPATPASAKTWSPCCC